MYSKYIGYRINHKKLTLCLFYIFKKVNTLIKIDLKTNFNFLKSKNFGTWVWVWVLGFLGSSDFSLPTQKSVYYDFCLGAMAKMQEISFNTIIRYVFFKFIEGFSLD
jgi:hypothetical protein